MDDTIRRLCKVLGGSSLESMGSDSRFIVESSDGAKLKVSIEGRQQRLMAVLVDGQGVSRADVDVAPILKVTEAKDAPGRVTVHVKGLLIHIDSEPTLAIEICTEE